ncbi:hypothetical protein [Limnothrix redekei]|uniref:Uncharacterized protein n=1 Tax=Limnothrix redekei LRLZ20PSL1 TaxID=3112953 RepID=A0ABW7CCA5_9CYAN
MPSLYRVANRAAIGWAIGLGLGLGLPVAIAPGAIAREGPPKADPVQVSVSPAVETSASEAAAAAVTSGSDALSDQPLGDPVAVELEPTRIFRRTGCFGDQPMATDQEIRQQGLTPPSLWLTRDLLGGKIVDRWTIHRGDEQLPPWVEVTFNLQPWNNLEYPRQYAYLNEFGRVAREYGFNVRVCNGSGDALAAQFCDWSQMRAGVTCPIYLPGGFSARARSRLF